MAQRALGFSQAVWATLLSWQQQADAEMNEVKEYLGLLHAKKAAIQLQVGEANEQIGVLCEVLHEHGISGALPSADECSDSSDCCPPSSIPTSYNETSQDPDLQERTKLEHQQFMDELMGDKGDWMLD